jgi:hypothetical protein
MQAIVTSEHCAHYDSAKSGLCCHADFSFQPGSLRCCVGQFEPTIGMPLAWLVGYCLLDQDIAVLTFCSRSPHCRGLPRLTVRYLLFVAFEETRSAHERVQEHRQALRKNYVGLSAALKALRRVVAMGSCCSVEPVDVEPGPYPTSDTASLHSDVGGEETWRAKGLKRSPALSDIASRSEQRRPSRGDALRVAIPNLVSEQDVLSPQSVSKPSARVAAAKVSPGLSNTLPRVCLWRARPCRGLPCRAPLCPAPCHSSLRCR